VFNPDIHDRHSIRLETYDYTKTGFYFLTLCTQGRKHFFGEIKNNKMELSESGKMIESVWMQIPDHYPEYSIDQFVVMPNHFHGIISIVGIGSLARPNLQNEIKSGQPQGVAPTGSLFDIVHRFKSLTTHHYLKGIKQENWPAIQGKLWQRNYWERIIRSDQELMKLQEYIQTNPAQWHLDSLNAKAGNHGGLPLRTYRKY
jgi:putative transposase